mgnify:FL=1
MKNRKSIQRLAKKSFLANRTRNGMAALAIALTTLLFSALFTTIISVNYSVEQQTMRQVGGYAHGGFKGLTKEQHEVLKEHPLVKEHGSNKMLTFLEEGLFSKHRVEVRYSDLTGAKMFFCEPSVGRMPKNSTDLATDTAVLDLLGVPHEIGASVTVPFLFHEETVEKTFTLCGYWETDEAIPVSQMWLSEEFVDDVLASVEPDTRMETASAGTWNLNLCFANSRHIEENLRTIARDCGFQTEDPLSDDYLDIGVNWAYTSTHTNSGEEIINVLAGLSLILLIIFVGYLIINNIFQISVAGDIRFYGLLKTIGTTGTQLKKIIRYQALRLCLAGIPAGLFLGYLAGMAVTSLVLETAYRQNAFQTLNPWIFIGSALFSILTVLISVRKPGKMAACVSPIEAVRYVDADIKLKKRSSRKRVGPKILQMAAAGLSRNRKKTAFVILSLSLSVVLFHTVCSIATGFDMDKFVGKLSSTDYLIAHEDYFQARFGSPGQSVPETLMETVESREGVKKTGRILRDTGIVQAEMTKAQYLKTLASMQLQNLDDAIRAMEDDEKGDFAVGLYGLDRLPFESLKFVGDPLSWEEFQGDHILIQILREDDYGNPLMEKAPFKTGDQVSLLVVDEYTYTGTELNPQLEILKSHRETYTIAASAILPTSLSVRRFGNAEFAMAAGQMQEEAGEQASVMSYLADMEEGRTFELENFLADYTKQTEPEFDFESRAKYYKEFDSLRRMFFAVGISASAIVALVGILNFVNAVVTGIRTRRRELAMLQSIGMTGKQLKEMLILEGCFYGVIAVSLSLVLNVLLSLLVMSRLEDMLWFFKARFIWYPVLGILPVFLGLGAVIPVLVYRSVQKSSIVERLRMTE